MTGLVKFPEHLVSAIVLNMAGRPQIAGDQPPGTFSWVLNVYNMLLYLDRRSALCFSLRAAIEQALVPLRSGPPSLDLFVLLENLKLDFLGMYLGPSLLYVAYFASAARHSQEDLNKIKQRMKHRTVTDQDIIGACLSNGCRTVTPIKYGLKFTEGFDVIGCTREITKALLNQPYRGIMLRELDSFLVQMGMGPRFHQQLASLVEEQGELHSEPP